MNQIAFRMFRLIGWYLPLVVMFWVKWELISILDFDALSVSENPDILGVKIYIISN